MDINIVPRNLLDQNVLFCAIEGRNVQAVKEYVTVPYEHIKKRRLDAANTNALGGLPITYSALMMLTED